MEAGAVSVAKRWNDFVFAARDPRLASVLRIGYGALLLINLAMWAPDLRLWFTESGVLPAAAAREIVDEHAPTILGWFASDGWPIACYVALVIAAVLLTVGWRTRIMAVAVGLGLTWFQNRNYAIVDGEDTLFRLFAFYLALCPAGWAFSLDARRRSPAQAADPPIPWGLRVFQIQIAVVYLSSAIEKTTGADWTSGHALYYVARLDDSFGKLPVPLALFGSLAVTQAMTWGVLALEWLLPFLLFWRRTRRWAIVGALVFHLAIEATMNLFLFHWLMILGILSFSEIGELAGGSWRPWRRVATG
ncbi:MAG TPA: HTTM domain-containing protein [Kofleriaceae bacterium]|nr:HTTM domain-containing protein [Kofleriaceae bacterium]